jgi:hypothetical protein
MADQQLVNGKVSWWIVGVLSTVLLSAGTAWLHAVQSGVDAKNEADKKQGERVAVLEHQMIDIRDRLHRIEQKLDRALSHP